MKKVYQKIKLIGFLSGLLLSSSCSFIDSDLLKAIFFDSDYVEESIAGSNNFNIHSHSPNTRGICLKYGSSSTSCRFLVPNYVFSVGNNSEFIIAKQHPLNGIEIDTTRTNYYILNMKSESNKKSDRLIGPLDLKSFKLRTLKLKIDGLEFDKIYPNTLN